MRSSNPPLDPGVVVAWIARDPSGVLTAHLPQIERIVGAVARRRGLLPQEAEELGSEIRLKLIENDYARLRAYAGRSSFETYLLICIQRLAQDLRDKELGAWEPSAEARRIGPHAVQLETLWVRDGLTLDECERMLAPRFPTLSPREIDEIAVRLPRRTRRRKVQDGDEVLEHHPASAPLPDQLLDERADFAAKRDVLAALSEEIAKLSIEDCLLIRLRIESGLKVSEIARQGTPGSGSDQRALYSRFEKIFATLKRGLAERGIGPLDAQAALRLDGRDEEAMS